MLSYFRQNKQFLYSVAALVGTMVGVGVFGLPLAFVKAGFWTGFIFLIIIALLTLLVDLMYGEIVLRTKSQHQVVGYAQLYLGDSFKKLVFFSVAFSSYAALLAYVIISGEFLTNVFAFWKLAPDAYSYIFWGFLSILIYFSVKRISGIEFLLAALFIFVVISIFFVGYGDIKFSNYELFNSFYWFLPYGILLFAFAGLAAIPIQKEILAGQENLLKKSIAWAVLIVGLLYLLFTFTVVGISGDITSPDAIKGLYEFLGNKIVFPGSLFGVLAVGMSYLMLGSALREIFQYDYGINKFLSWFLVVSPPLIMFIGGIRTFLDVIGLAGAVALGLEMAVLALVYIKAKKYGDRTPEYSLKIPSFMAIFLVILFIAGLIYTLIN